MSNGMQEEREVDALSSDHSASSGPICGEIRPPPAPAVRVGHSAVSARVWTC